MSKLTDKLNSDVELDQSIELETTNEIIKSAPTLPDETFNNLPDILDKIVCEEIHNGDKRKRDVALLSSIISLSGMFPTVSSVYYHEKVYSNLYLFVVGKASSGKSIMKVGKDILKAYDDILISQNELKLKVYNEEKIEWESFTNKERVGKIRPKEPKLKYSYMSPNISSSKFIDLLNDGVPLMFSTEADVLSNTNKQDWGDYLSELRFVFHHDEIIKDRKVDGRIIVEEPKLSILLSGTLDQTFKVLGKSQDGLFSRFMIYLFSSERVYQSPFSNSSNSDYLKKNVNKEILRIIEFYEKGEFVFSLDSNQQDLFNKYANRMFNKSTIFDDEGDIDGVIYRHCLIAYRMIMIFSILRNYNQSLFDIGTIKAIDEDVKICLNIANVMLQHSKIIFYSQQEKKTTLIENKKEKAFKILIKYEQFTRQEAQNFTKEMNISERQLDRVLKSMLDAGLFEKVDRFTFKRIK
jgi:hypothetical protein